MPSILVEPFPAYISLQTALYYHGMISQIPSTVYAVSLARTCLIKTPISIVSIHHIQSALFFGYEEKLEGQFNLATPEKALVDILYFSPAKSRLFHTLPELEFPENFNINLAKKMIDKIESKSRRALVIELFNAIIDTI